ncbi:MAG: hypothetical protein PHT88_05630 [Candidatus Moranbacteria bacterium]|nr:hypothetical protein [Candidatus Moranbacteria bacterium]
MKLTQQDMARLLDVDARTLRNWKNTKPYLYKIIMQGFAIEDIRNALHTHCDNLDKMINETNPSHNKDIV